MEFCFGLKTCALNCTHSSKCYRMWYSELLEKCQLRWDWMNALPNKKDLKLSIIVRLWSNQYFQIIHHIESVFSCHHYIIQHRSIKFIRIFRLSLFNSFIWKKHKMYSIYLHFFITLTDIMDAFTRKTPWWHLCCVQFMYLHYIAHNIPQRPQPFTS